MVDDIDVGQRFLTILKFGTKLCRTSLGSGNRHNGITFQSQDIGIVHGPFHGGVYNVAADICHSSGDSHFFAHMDIEIARGYLDIHFGGTAEGIILATSSQAGSCAQSHGTKEYFIYQFHELSVN